MSADDVTNEQLLLDIENTKKEAEAYTLIASGEKILASLPENAGDRFHNNRVIVLEANANDCRKFLARLNDIKQQRGL